MHHQPTNVMLLVDGHNMLFRMFFGVPARITSKDGRPIHGVVGFLGALLKIASSMQPTHLLVVFDSESRSFREKIRPGYKRTRIRDFSQVLKEENPFSQLAGIRNAMDYLNWKHCEVSGFEADDVLAAYARKYKETHKITIVSTDTDLLQLVQPNVGLFYPWGEKSTLYTPEKVQEKFGVPPKRMPDLKALMGDKADNISGVPGIGKKTAQKLIRQFGEIGKIHKYISEIFPETLRKKILDHRDLIRENLSLVILDRHCDLPFVESLIRVSPISWEKKTMQVLRDIELV